LILEGVNCTCVDGFLAKTIPPIYTALRHKMLVNPDDYGAFAISSCDPGDTVVDSVK